MHRRHRRRASSYSCTGKAPPVRDSWFKDHFTSSDNPLDRFEGPPSPLDTPIVPHEVKVAAKSLKNGRATGSDGLQNELLKYASDDFYSCYAHLVNQCFETNTVIDAFGQGYIQPLQKPGKPKGPLKRLRLLYFQMERERYYQLSHSIRSRNK